MFGETINIIMSSATPVLIAFITFFGKNRFDKLGDKITSIDDLNRKEHEIISEQLYGIASNYSAEKKIIKIAAEAGQFADPTDKNLLVFINACVNVSVHFYNELSSRGLNFCTEEDIERASSGAIGYVDNAKKAFNKDFTDTFWEEFVNNAVDIRAEFLEIFQDEFNRKDERFIMSIERYLFNQLKMVIKKRNKWNK